MVPHAMYTAPDEILTAVRDRLGLEGQTTTSDPHVYLGNSGLLRSLVRWHP